MAITRAQQVRQMYRTAGAVQAAYGKSAAKSGPVEYDTGLERQRTENVFNEIKPKNELDVNEVLTKASDVNRIKNAVTGGGLKSLISPQMIIGKLIIDQITKDRDGNQTIVQPAFADGGDVSGPEGGFRFARGLQIHGSDGTITWMEQRDTTFIDEYAKERSTTDSDFTGQPKYWANWDATTLIVAPTPNIAYTVEMWYDETPERLGNGTGTTSTTTFISNNAPEVLLYGVLSETFSYLKNTQDMQLYTQKFQNALQAFANEQMGRKRRDEYVDGVLRVPLPSADPKA